jgi:hypothetical protein
MSHEVVSGEVYERQEDYTACRGLDEKVAIRRISLNGKKFNEDRTNVEVFSDDIMKRLQFLITMERNMKANHRALMREVQQHLTAIPLDILEDPDNGFINEYYLENPERRNYTDYKVYPSLSGARLGDLVIQILCLKLIIGLY